jgi:RHS repeat-associated protein
MLASGYNNSTTTYAYDEFGSRVLQTSTTSTTYYPNKYFSTMSTIVGSTTYATSTNYIWNGDTLLATIDQKLINGTATGTPIMRYIHPDHLGSTNAVTDQNGNLVQLLDYYPYGATRVSTSSYPTNEKRQYIDQFSDAQTGLNYFNARFYDGSRGQFLSEDPSYLSIGNPMQIAQLSGQNQKTLLMDPQLLNVYGYARDNPIGRKDTDGRFSIGVSYSGNLEAGFGAFHASYASTNLNLIVNPAAMQAWVVYSNSGAVTSGYLKNYVSAPDNGQVPFVLGIFGGGGVSVNLSPNSTNPKDIDGTQDSINANIVPLSFSVQGAGTDNPSYSVGLGVKGLASVSRYPIYTQTTATYSVNQAMSRAANQAASAYQQALNNIQVQLNKIQGIINQLSTQIAQTKN